jgi:hypothetical protein
MYHGASTALRYGETVAIRDGLSSSPTRGADMDDDDYPITSLVDAAAAGDEEAWHEIVDRYSPLLGSVIRRFRLATAETQDVAQTASR